MVLMILVVIGGGNGGSGVVYVSVSQTGSLQSSMTLISDTFIRSNSTR